MIVRDAHERINRRIRAFPPPPFASPPPFFFSLFYKYDQASASVDSTLDTCRHIPLRPFIRLKDKFKEREREGGGEELSRLLLIGALKSA
jgi:hypothetical protein